MESLRKTPQREIILKCVKHSKKHPTAEMIYEEVKHQLPSISLATVYRNLNLLAEKGEVNRIEVGHETHFDGDTRHHHHFVCRKCNEIYDKHSRNLCEEVKRIWQRDGFLAERTNIISFGTCKRCKR